MGDPVGMDKIDFVLAGVGGQGIVLMSDLLADAALAAGFDVKKSDVHGMAQRGGSVVSFVRMGREVASPLVARGRADFLVALEKLEAARWASYLKPGGVAVVSDHAIYPLSVSAGKDSYPTEVEVASVLSRHTDRFHLVRAVDIASELGNSKVVNVIVLGFVAALLPLPWELWVAAVERRVPAKHRDLNLRALESGRSAALAASSR